MKRRVLPALLLLVAGVWAAVGAAPVQAEENWTELRSPHFQVVTNANPKQATEVTQRLEAFRHLLATLFPGLRLDPPVPTTLLLFRNEKSIHPYLPRTPEGKDKQVAGFLQPGRERMDLAVDLSAPEAEATAFHEYMHLVLRLNFTVLPLWMDEGLAEFFETTEIDGEKFTLGRYQPGWWRLLQESRLMPLAALFGVDHDSPYYNDREKSHLFYAEAWLLAHYWMIDGGGARQKPFMKLIERLREGATPEAALEEAFGTDAAGMMKQLEDYLNRSRLQLLQGKLREAAVAVTSAPLAPAAATAYAADLWLNSGRLEEAEKALEPLAPTPAGQAGSGSPEVAYRLGLIALERGEIDKAEQDFQSVLRARPEDIGARYYAAWAVREAHITPEASAEERRAAADQVVELLEPLLRSENPLPDAYTLAVRARLARDDPPETIIPLLERARRAMPEQRTFDFLLGTLYVQQQNWAEARELFEKVAQQSSDPAEQAEAGQWLARLDTLTQPPLPLAQPRREGPGPGAAPDSPVRAGGVPVEPQNAPAPPAPPPMAYVRGTLVEVTCEGPAAVLRVEREGKKKEELRLRVPIRVQAILIDPSESRQQLECGTLNVPVGINYIVEPAGVGTVVTIEFYPPER